MNYSCSGAEWNKGSEDTGGVVSGFKDLLLLLYVVFFCCCCFSADQAPTMPFHRGSAATSWDTEPQG